MFIAVFIKKSPFMQYQTSIKVAIPKNLRDGALNVRWRSREWWEFILSPVVSSPSGSGVKPQLQAIFGLFIRNIVRFYACFDVYIIALLSINSKGHIARKNCNNCHEWSNCAYRANYKRCIKLWLSHLKSAQYRHWIWGSAVNSPVWSGAKLRSLLILVFLDLAVMRHHDAGASCVNSEKNSCPLCGRGPISRMGLMLQHQ